MRTDFFHILEAKYAVVLVVTTHLTLKTPDKIITDCCYNLLLNFIITLLMFDAMHVKTDLESVYSAYSAFTQLNFEFSLNLL